MKTAIIYTSKKGTTKKVAHHIADKLGTENSELIDIKKNKNIEFSKYDMIVLGSPIYAGNPANSMRKFYSKYMQELVNRPLSLFVCGMEDQYDKRQVELNNAYPEQLIKHSKASGFMGGEFLFEKMNFLEKAIIKKIAKTDKSVSSIDVGNIDLFIAEISKS